METDVSIINYTSEIEIDKLSDNFSIENSLFQEDHNGLTPEDHYYIKLALEDVEEKRVVDSSTLWKSIDQWFESDKNYDLVQSTNKLYGSHLWQS